MPRIVSVWLKDWPIARLLQTQRKKSFVSQAEIIDPGRPLALVAPGKGGARIVAVNATALSSGVIVGELLSNARSKARALQSREADPSSDAAALRQLALWCQRYTPNVMDWDEANGADGLFLDITGCAHLFGGERALLDDIAHRLRRFGLVPRIAAAGTLGASWGITRFDDKSGLIVPPDGEAAAIRDLPLSALRLSDETLALLHRLGFRKIGDLTEKPRAPLTARFGAHLLLRLDQALGCAPEPIDLIRPPPRYHALVTFAEPIMTEEHVLVAARRALSDLLGQLVQDCASVRRFRFLLFRVDGEVASLEIGLATPSRDAEHMARLIALRLGHLYSGLDAGFGFEAAAIHVLEAQPLPGRQDSLYVERSDEEGLSRLFDRLEQRLGTGAVRRLHSRGSHIPEGAVAERPAAESAPSDWAIGRSLNARPVQLLRRPEEIGDVMELIPEGPPRRFLWRGVLHRVAHAEGPERIAPEWWRRRKTAEGERDYYVVEDENGRRFWLFRSGLYRDETVGPRWFVHGVFA